MATLTPNKKPQLTTSMLEMLSRCGIQFGRRYGARFGCAAQEEIIPPGIALGVGLSVHKAVERNLHHKMEKGVLLPAGEVAAIGRDYLDEMFAASEVVFTDEEALDIAGAKGAAIDQVVALSRLHHSEVAPKIDPAALEEPFVIELKGYPIDLAGRKDIREKSGDIRDTKTSGKTPSESDSWTPQTAAYSLAEAVRKKHPDTGELGPFPETVSLDYLIKTKTPKVVTLVTKNPTMAMVQPYLRRVERAIEIIDAVKSGKRAFMPAQANDWVCTKKFCGYAQTCPFWTGR